MPAFAEETGAEVKAKLHRHVEARYAGDIDLDPREIVDTPIAFADHRRDLADPDVRAVCRIQRATRMIARRDDRENHRAQDRLKPVVERAIDEDGLGGWWFRRAPLRHAPARTWSAARRGSLRLWASACHSLGRS